MPPLPKQRSGTPSKGETSNRGEGSSSQRKATPPRRPVTPRHLREAREAPGPGAYDTRGSPPDAAGGGASSAFKTKADRSLVNKSQAALPGVGQYDPHANEKTASGVGSAFKSKGERFQAAPKAVGPGAYSQAHGTMAAKAAAVARAPSSSFASTNLRWCAAPLPKELRDQMIEL